MKQNTESESPDAAERLQRDRDEAAGLSMAQVIAARKRRKAEAPRSVPPPGVDAKKWAFDNGELFEAAP